MTQKENGQFYTTDFAPTAGEYWARGFLARLDGSPRDPSQNKDWNDGWVDADATISDAHGGQKRALK